MRRKISASVDGGPSGIFLCVQVVGRSLTGAGFLGGTGGIKTLEIRCSIDNWLVHKLFIVGRLANKVFTSIYFQLFNYKQNDFRECFYMGAVILATHTTGHMKKTWKFVQFKQEHIRSIDADDFLDLS